MKRTYTLLAIGCGLLFVASTCFAQMYTVTDLGTLGGTVSAATSINASGQVAGGSFTNGDLESHAFRTAPNRAINPATDDLGVLIGNGSYATGINASGQAVGQSNGPPNFHALRAFRTAPNSPINPATDNLSTFGGDSASANAINDAGQVVGASATGGSVSFFHAFRTVPNNPINPETDDLGTLGGTSASAFGINVSGQVVGFSLTSDNSISHPFRTAPNKAINPSTDDLGTLGGSFGSAAHINGFGQAVGFSEIGDNGIFHAFLVGAHKKINPATDDLGTLGGAYSEATSIDDFGQVVGWATTMDGTAHAFIYAGRVMRDLNNLVPSDFACKVSQAADINEAGQIAANAECGAVAHAILLTPVYQGLVRPPIKADGSSVFSAKRESVSVAFLLNKYGTRTCALPPATIAIVRVADGRLTTARNAKLSITGCRYAYDLKPNRVGVGMYRADVSINGIMVGHAAFAVE